MTPVHHASAQGCLRSVSLLLDLDRQGKLQQDIFQTSDVFGKTPVRPMVKGRQVASSD